MIYTYYIQKLIEDSAILYRQAIACPRTGKVSHYEILSRFWHNGGMHPPAEFVAWLESHDLIAMLDRYAIAQVLQHLKQTGDTRKYAVNLSAQTVNQNGQFTKFLASQRAIHEFQDFPLILEITETVALENNSMARSVLNFVRSMGSALAVDDFGSPTGNFSTFALDTLQPQYLKIDGWYAHRLPDPVAIADINAYCAIAHARGIKVILEQVEGAHFDIVRDKTDVDLVQGWAIGQPERME